MRHRIVSALFVFGLVAAGAFIVATPTFACVTDATRAAAAVINPETNNWELKRVCLTSARSQCLPPSGSDEAVLCCPPAVPGVPEGQACPAGTNDPAVNQAAEQTAANTAARSTWIPTEVQACMRTGNCTLDHIVRTGAAFANFLFGISGAIFLLTFVYGGFLYLTAGGSSENVKKAQKMLIDASIGMVLMFGASTLIRFIHKTVTPPSRCESEQASRGYACMYVVGNTPQERQRNGSGCLQNLCNLPGQGENIMCCPVSGNTAAGGAAGGTGTCRCGLSTIGDIASVAASDSQIDSVRQMCQSNGGTFSRDAMTCVGPTTEEQCRQLNDSSSLISCRWSR